MAVADQRLKKKDIIEKFIISAQYGTSDAFPKGSGSTIVLCEVSWKESSNKDNWKPAKVLIHKNGGHREHAETKLLQDLKDISDKATKINLKLIQNYSPCNDKKGGVFCAKKIWDYKKEMEGKGKELDITITFANFYCVGELGDKERTKENKQGIRLLIDSGVKIELLAGKEKWDAFLKDTRFVNLTTDERRKCFLEADSKERKEREKKDEELLREIRALHMQPTAVA